MAEVLLEPNRKIQDESYRSVLFLLRLAAFSVFIGRAYQHIFWDAPYRVLWWNEEVLEPVVIRVFGITWNEFITSDLLDAIIQYQKILFGILFFVCAVIAVTVKKSKKLARLVFIIGGGFLLLLAILYTVEKYNQVGQLMEVGCQLGSVILLYLMIFKKVSMARLGFLAAIMISLTFTGHALYAMGHYPVPGSFVDMTIKILHVSESEARLFLKVAGMMDMVVAIGVFMPSKVQKPILYYAILWGGLTALARVVANFHADFMLESIHQWAYSTFYRLPNALLPLILLMIKSDNLRLLFTKKKQVI